MGRVALVTGVSLEPGQRFARQLCGAAGVDRVIGVDVLPPHGDLGEVQFVRADIRNPVIAKVIAREGVDTVVHLSVIAGSGGAGGASQTKELNVIGTMQLLAACQQAPDLEHLVVKSSTAVYGASSRDPAMFTEGSNPKQQPRRGFAKDVNEVEQYVRGFARRRPDVRVTTLRTAHVLGPTVTAPMTSYFRLPVIPTVLGFDARMQFLHERDQLAALEHATLSDVAGTFNIAGDGLLMLSQAVRRLGKPAVPLPAFGVSLFGQAVRQSGLADFSAEQIDFLTYGRGVDTTRMRTELGFEPTYNTTETFADFARALGPGPLSPQRVAAAEQLIAGALGTRAVGSGPVGSGAGGSDAVGGSRG